MNVDTAVCFFDDSITNTTDFQEYFSDKMIMKNCDELNAIYIDGYSKLSDENGYMTDNYTVDGAHLSNTGKMYDYKSLKLI